MSYNNVAEIWELCIALYISLDVGHFLLNFLHSQDLKAALQQSVNINTGRLQANSGSALSIVIENIWTACVPLMWNKKNRVASQSL